MKRTVRMAAIVVGALVLLLCIAMVVASITEPRPITGERRVQHPAVQAYAATEETLFEHLGVQTVSRTLELQSPALRVHVREVPGEGPPVVLLHGGGSSLVSWAPLVAQLRGRHLFLVDRPGCGQTDGFEYSDDVELRGHAGNFVAGVMDGLHLARAKFVANSMGGLWSIWFALDHPERVEELALVGCPALWPGTSGPIPYRLMGRPGIGALMTQLQPEGPAATRKLLARLAGEHAAASVPPELLAAAQAARAIPGVGRSFRTLVQQVLTLTDASAQYALTPMELEQLTVPVLLVWGSTDIFGTVEDAKRVLPSTGRFRLKVVEGGHLPWLDQPQEVARSVANFLDDPQAAELEVDAAQDQAAHRAAAP
jgi:pimeloyl-ACP methyl ester carboxylesterase